MQRRLPTRIFLAGAVAASVAGAAVPALAQAPLKIGFMAELSGPQGALGQDQCDFTPRLFPLGPWDDQPFSGHYYLIHNVADALLGRARLVIRPEETLNTLAAIDLFYMSAEAGREAKREEIEIRPGAGEHRRRGTASAGV